MGGKRQNSGRILKTELEVGVWHENKRGGKDNCDILGLKYKKLDSLSPRGGWPWLGKAVAGFDGWRSGLQFWTCDL